MLPFSKYMHRIWSRTHTPVISVWVNVVFCALLGLIDLASFTAITAIFNVLTPCIYTDAGYRRLRRLELLHPHSLQSLTPRDDISH